MDLILWISYSYEQCPIGHSRFECDQWSLTTNDTLNINKDPIFLSSTNCPLLKTLHLACFIHLDNNLKIFKKLINHLERKSEITLGFCYDLCVEFISSLFESSDYQQC